MAYYRSDKMKVFFLLLACLVAISVYAQQPEKADKPLFRDPVHDGAADPVVVYNRSLKNYFMFYTNRRAQGDSLRGVTWVHGTNIGIASSDNGAAWDYEGICNFNYSIKNIENTEVSFWAPEVIYSEGIYHMYITVVPGVFADWNHPRDIVHFTSKNLKDWDFQSKLNLSSERCIDASVFRLPNGNWRMYYNNENDDKSIYYADSPNLYNWTDSGNKVIETRGEGAKIFHWKDKNWMIIDSWNGLSVFQSEDLKSWKQQENRILEIPGTGRDDKVKGGHADVWVQEDRAFIFYFTHPDRTPDNEGLDNYQTRRSSLQIAELKYKNGNIFCDRNEKVFLHLKPPTK